MVTQAIFADGDADVVRFLCDMEPIPRHKPSLQYALAAVAAAILALCLLLVWRQPAAAPVPVSVQAVWMHPRDWVGRTIRVNGVLKVFEQGTPAEHYAVEEGGFRVGLLGLDAQRLRSALGQTVRAEGAFGFSERFGVYIRLGRLEPR